MSNKTLADELIRLFIHRNDIYAKFNKVTEKWVGNIQKPITPALIQQHVKGEVTIGVYIINKFSTTKFCAFDIDDHDEKDTIKCKKTSLKIAKHLHNIHGLTPIIERSGGGKGRHVFVCFEPTKLYKVRQFAKQVLEELDLKDIEILPPNDSKDGIGGFVKLPCGIHGMSKKRSKFLLPSNFTNPLVDLKYRKNTSKYLKLITQKPFVYVQEDDEDVEFILDEEETPTINEETKIIKSIDQTDNIQKRIITKLVQSKSCIQAIYKNNIQLNGNPGHLTRVNIMRDLILANLSPEDCHEYYKTQSDYSASFVKKKYNEEYIKLMNEQEIFDKREISKAIEAQDEETFYVEKKNYKPLTRCGKMKTNLKHIKEIKSVCEACDMAYIAKRKANNGDKVSFEDLFLPFFIDRWKAIQKHGIKSKRGEKCILISREDFMKYSHISKEEYSGYIFELKNLRFIQVNNKNEESFRKSKNDRTRVIKFRINEINKKMKSVKVIQR